MNEFALKVEVGQSFGTQRPSLQYFPESQSWVVSHPKEKKRKDGEKVWLVKVELEKVKLEKITRVKIGLEKVELEKIMKVEIWNWRPSNHVGKTEKIEFDKVEKGKFKVEKIKLSKSNWKRSN